MREQDVFLGSDQALGAGRFDRKPVLNYSDPDFRGLRHLVDLPFRDAEKIAQNAMERPDKIQLLDFIDQIGLSNEAKTAIRERQVAFVPAERKSYLEKLAGIVKTIPSMEPKLSQARINPFTQFENNPPLLFGMGGGSKTLNRGFPIDILNMVLTAEKLRRCLNLGRCRVICANGITYTNIPKSSEFSKQGIDRVLGSERDLLQLVVERFGIADHWDIFLETDVERIIGRELKEQYDRMIVDADTVGYIGGHHYAIEMAQMHSLLNQEKGGVKLGWFMRHLEKTHGGYIMDEQPFDARYTMYLADRELPNRTSIPYAHAGVRLYPGTGGLVNKAAPYICYEPEDRILLRPQEDPVQKLRDATDAGGGLHLRGVRRHFGSLIKLFEEVVINRTEHLLTPGLDKPIERGVKIEDVIQEKDGEHRPEKVGRRLQFILDYIFEGNRSQAEELYNIAFPNPRP